jgi:hypothetical protein
VTDPEGGSAPPLRVLAPILVVLALVALCLAAWAAFEQGQRSAGHDAGAEAQRREILTGELKRLAAENRKLQAKVAELEMSRRLDRDAYGQVERTLGNLQSQLARQGDDLAFYRSIVSPADGIQGLRIQRFEVAPGAAPREVLLRLTLVQAMRHESLVSGLAQVTISGMQGDHPTRFTVGELLGRPRAQLPFSFRYFQTIEQAVTLPEGFQAFEAYVQVQSSKISAPLQQAFAWKVGDQAAL